MQLTSDSFADGQPILPPFAFCRPAPEGHIAPGGDRSPHLRWSGAPEGTRSFAIVMHDPDVPADASDVNTEGKTIPADAPRVDFFHWLLVDIPAGTTELAEGAASSERVVGGKAPGPTPHGLAGVNDFTGFLAGSPLEGTYGGYDGPCPPWNDERLHHYHVTVFALDVASLGLDPDGDFRGADVRAAMEGHVLAQASITGTFTTNPALL